MVDVVACVWDLVGIKNVIPFWFDQALAKMETKCLSNNITSKIFVDMGQIIPFRGTCVRNAGCFSSQQGNLCIGYLHFRRRGHHKVDMELLVSKSNLKLDMPVLVASHWLVPAVVAVTGLLLFLSFWRIRQKRRRRRKVTSSGRFANL
jgi:hypothetical protein